MCSRCHYCSRFYLDSRFKGGIVSHCILIRQMKRRSDVTFDDINSCVTQSGIGHFWHLNNNTTKAPRRDNWKLKEISRTMHLDELSTVSLVGDQFSPSAILNVVKLAAYIPLKLFERNYQNNINKCIFKYIYIYFRIIKYTYIVDLFFIIFTKRLPSPFFLLVKGG